jgi:biotin transport system substrate-specific component
LYLFGTLWLQYQLSLSFPAALMAGVIPYIPGDVVKLILAIAVATPLKKQLLKARLL